MKYKYHSSAKQPIVSIMLPALALFLFMTFCESANLPSDLQKCYRNQPNFKDCIFKAVTDALPRLNKPHEEVNWPSLNPFELEEVKIGSNNGQVALSQDYKNVKIYGLSELKTDKFEFDFDKKTLEMSGNFPEIKLTGDYKLDGKILLLPIKGEGFGTMTLKNSDAVAIASYEEVKKKSKTYFKFNSVKITLKPSLMTFNLENLFDGDKVLGDNIHKVLNENWESVYADLGPDYIAILEKMFLQMINNLFSKVSVEEAFD